MACSLLMRKTILICVWRLSHGAMKLLWLIPSARIGLSKSVAAIRTVLRSVCGKGIATSCPLPFPWQRKSGF